MRGVRLRLSSLGGAQARDEYRERLQAHLRAHRDALSPDVAARIELNPLRAGEALFSEVDPHLRDRGWQLLGMRRSSWRRTAGLDARVTGYVENVLVDRGSADFR